MTTERLVEDLLTLWRQLRNLSSPVRRAEMAPEQYWLLRLLHRSGSLSINAIYPIAIMPGWLQVIAHINPLTYVVDGVRALMLSGGSSESGLGTDIVVLLAITLILAVICARLYPRIVQ